MNPYLSSSDLTLRARRPPEFVIVTAEDRGRLVGLLLLLQGEELEEGFDSLPICSAAWALTGRWIWVAAAHRRRKGGWGSKGGKQEVGPPLYPSPAVGGNCRERGSGCVVVGRGGDCRRSRARGGGVAARRWSWERERAPARARERAGGEKGGGFSLGLSLDH